MPSLSHAKCVQRGTSTSDNRFHYTFPVDSKTSMLQGGGIYSNSSRLRLLSSSVAHNDGMWGGGIRWTCNAAGGDYAFDILPWTSDISR